MQTLFKAHQALPTLPTLAAFLCLAPVAAQAQYDYVTNNGTITITRYTGPGGDVTIPSTIAGLPVSSIGYMAFSDCTSLTKVLIGNGVTSIGDWAFAGCTSLTNVTIPDSVTTIGQGTFRYCPNLTAITVDPVNSVYSSVDGVLFDKSETTLIQCPGGKAGSYTIPDSVTTIGWGAFSNCSSLTSVIIPNGVTNIGAWAFSDCTSLTSVTIGNSVTSIPFAAFSSCTSLTDITIGNSVTNIGGWAFSGCTSLTGVYFYGDAPSADSSVFAGADSVTVYYLPGTTGWEATFAGRPAVPLTPAEGVVVLMAQVQASGLAENRIRPLTARLEAAQGSFARESLGAGVNQLGAFQNKVRAQVAPRDAALAAAWISEAQRIIDAVRASAGLRIKGGAKP